MPQSNNNNNNNNSSKNNNNKNNNKNTNHIINNNINNNNINNTTSTCNISSKDRVKISREYKKIKCLDTLAKKYKCTINQIEKIVKEKKKKTRSTIKANSYLVSLLDKVVYEWFQRAQRLIETGTITDEMFIQKAHESKQIFGLTDFPTDYEWVCNFRKKYNITKLDMILLRIENDNRPLSVDINDIVMFVLKNNPITEYLPYTSPSLQDNTTESEKDSNPIQYLICYDDDNNINETIISDNIDEITEIKSEILPVIANDEQAIRHLKPLEDYALLRENFRAIGLIAQLEEIFAPSETNQQTN